ncbi:response regulator transcription factor [Parageobacillus thermoglucosidasius]|uniref:Two component transcriptional regulator, winged helix family n=1 Tax=Geobacillus sp. (strain Y4.1MC1) TaxID=581103 RepID=A0A7U4DMR4_GEOS0|nr:response regulator transcription factor [Parageobacillus thermoglucosidasius]MED4904017.1 response regulator transcription factor [Parageobacillus thermoglucosidasius]MED4914954.1 response regulator transcription factor [Parageobacillus thermoglucosidasius]MED4943774.1 response regulator transcription factor [Parageobacillus thermoglucosidasius]MED4984218.1 response regulator transcription factor [Parageobacillus thermoglucosidasius]RDE18682.1 DNA-binding response regulator [Parageobacillus
MENARILIVDDEEAILNMLKLVFNKEGFTSVHTCTNGTDALHLLEQKKFDLIILDIMLPDLSGLEMCRAIRKGCDAPLFFISAKSSDLDKLTGFAHGCDDYITKPFNPLEVVARVKAQLQRYLSKENKEKQSEILDFGRFQLNLAAAELIVEGKPVPCSAQVYRLLAFFCKHPNQVFTKEQLYYQVWGEDQLVDDNTVMVHIRKIREKIEKDPSKPQYLKTIRGIGYKLVTEEKRKP